MTSGKEGYILAKCDLCNQEMQTADGCNVVHYILEDGTQVEQIPVGNRMVAYVDQDGRCLDCGAKYGYLHHPGCNNLKCGICGLQIIKCNCNHSNKLDVWTTTWLPIVNTQLKSKGETSKEDGYNFCVLAGKEYSLKVIAFHHSLQKNCNNFKLWICCMDDLTFSLLKKLNLVNVHLLHVKEIEDDRLRKVKEERKLNEYCWTLKAPLIEFVLTKYEIDKLLYCDGDMYFFSDPATIFNEWGESSVYLCPQRDLDWVERKYGKFQAGLIGFKKDNHGMDCLRWWKERCIEWCHAAEDSEGRFGDQKYLDNFPIFFQKVKISNHLGIDAAPWNCIYNNNFEISTRNNNVYIQEDKLVAFHFACLTIYGSDTFDLWSLGSLNINNNIIDKIYAPYLDEIRSIIKEIYAVNQQSLSECLSKQDSSQAKTFYKYTSLRREMDQWDKFFNFAMIISKDYLIKGLTCYYSLKKQMDNFHLWVCCVDKISYEILAKLNLKNVTLIPVEQLEDKELLKVKNNRTLQEYCWTLKAPLCQHILKNYGEVDHIIYCDSDLYFFSNPSPILEQWAKYSIFLCRQRGSAELERVHGQYQAGLIGFKKEPNSLKMVNWWKEKCLERCSSIYDERYGTWGDQKYLDAIPHLFSNIKLFEDVGIDTAPWNLIMNNNHVVSKNEQKVFIDDSELIVYHFGSLLMFNENEYDLWKLEPFTFEQSILENIYVPYLNELKKTSQIVKDQNRYKDLSILFSNPPDKYDSKNPYNL